MPRAGQGLLPNHVHLVAPGIDAEHGADADHVVTMLTQVLHILVFDRHVGKQLKVLGRSLEHRVKLKSVGSISLQAF